jgi:hypothetical protein
MRQPTFQAHPTGKLPEKLHPDADVFDRAAQLARHVLENLPQGADP